MAKMMADIAERLVVQYEIHYNEDKLGEDETLEDHIAKFSGNMWKAMSESDVINDISHNQILDYLDSEHNTLSLNN